MDSRTGFPQVDDTVVAAATKSALTALADPGTPGRLARFYDPRSNFAGATFALLEPRDPDLVTAVDLLAVTALSVDIPPLAVRTLLEDTTTAQDLSERLRTLPPRKLQDTTEFDFGSMGDFYDAIKTSLARAGTKSSNPWVTASKLVARKRPDLFPVRDNVVCTYLGINKLGYYAKDWYVFRTLMNTPVIIEQLEQLPDRIRQASDSQQVVLDDEPLRLLDAVLWRFGTK